MTAILALGLGVIVVLSLVGIVARLVRWGIGALAGAACLGWLAVAPSPRLFPTAWWLLAAWLLALTVRAVRRSCRG